MCLFDNFLAFKRLAHLKDHQTKRGEREFDPNWCINLEFLSSKDDNDGGDNVETIETEFCEARFVQQSNNNDKSTEEITKKGGEVSRYWKKSFLLCLLTLAFVNFRKNHTNVTSVLGSSKKNTTWYNTEMEKCAFAVKIRMINQDHSDVRYANQVIIFKNLINLLVFCFSTHINIFL